MRNLSSARRPEVEAARVYGSHVFPADELHESGWEPVLETIPKGSAVYVTIDADDGMDPTEMPGVMAGRLLVNVLGASWAPEGAMRRR